MGLDLVEMILRVEKDFDVSLPDDELGTVTTVGALHNLLLEKLDVLADAARAEQIWRELQDIVVAELAVPRDAVTPDAHFQKDLGRT